MRLDRSLVIRRLPGHAVIVRHNEPLAFRRSQHDHFKASDVEMTMTMEARLCCVAHNSNNLITRDIGESNGCRTSLAFHRSQQ